MSSILHLRCLWLDEENKFAKAYRILSDIYMRKHSLAYIFMSKVKYIDRHLKYGKKVRKGLSDPKNFTSLKDY